MMYGVVMSNKSGAEFDVTTPFGFVNHFAKRFHEKFNEPYPVSKSKHCALFKRAINMYGAKKTQALLHHYFETRDTWKIEWFWTAIPQLIGEQSKVREATSHSMFDKLEDAKKKRGLD